MCLIVEHFIINIYFCFNKIILKRNFTLYFYLMFFAPKWVFICLFLFYFLTTEIFRSHGLYEGEEEF